MEISFGSLLAKVGIGSLGFWKALAIFFALLNLKHIPFGWHTRLLNAIWTHYAPSKDLLLISKVAGPSALFQPMIISSRAQLLECDYNFHKSNSTYFADSDVGRLHLMFRLFQRGITRTGRELWAQNGYKGPKRVWIMLGGVSCNFRREIKPYQAFEIWTRVLSWDHKWIYVITHFVKKGAVKPPGYTLQPGKKAGRPATKSSETSSNGSASKDKSVPHSAIFATGISKYVAKHGRFTVPPERIIESSGLLPPKPADHATPQPTTDSPAVPLEGTAVPTEPMSTVQDLTSSGAQDLLDVALSVKHTADGEWDWERVEQERRRGMAIAEGWTKLEALHDEFTGDERAALGHFRDVTNIF